eukprot:3596591-Karenia_brevis.AAC.1
MFDLTVSMPLVGHLLGQAFHERVGVREGAVESPHLFNAYIDDIKGRLETLHPRLCRLLDITIPIVLYADDAALPASTVEDLRLSVSIFEEFCNQHQLFISTPKTFFTVFHNPSDQGVKYTDKQVLIDGIAVEIAIYGKAICATP